MSDHISGPRALADPIADITDVYAFPSPETPGRLVLVLNTLPMAKPSDLFSAGLLYRFRLRPLTPPTSAEAGWHFVPGQRGAGPRLRLRPPRARVRRGPTRPSAARDLRDTGRGPGLVPRQRRAGGHGARTAGLRRRALGSVHHGCPRRPGDDRDPEARLHRPRVDLPRRQERAEHRGRDRHGTPGRLGARRRRRRDPDPRRVQRPDRTGGASRGEEHDARPEGVRPGEPGPGDPRPLQHGRRFPPRRLLRRRLPSAAGRQPRLLGRPGRQRSTGPSTRTAATRSPSWSSPTT